MTVAAKQGTRLSRAWLRAASAESPAEAASTPAASTTGPLGMIGARYQLINEIGHGGMGSVHRVLDRLTGRILTLKRLKMATGLAVSSPDARVVLADEFRILASLRHPNIISVLDYGFDDDREPYFTMDLQENARTIVEAGTDQPLAVQLDLLVQTLRALVYLHRCGIIHRDLKPENILVVNDQVKILDFGLSFSRSAGDAGEVGWGGTPAYTAPEVLKCGSPNERSDLYAVGMIAYELFVGRYPFAEDQYLPLRIMNTPLPGPNDAIDPRLRPILERLLAKDPEARYAEASAVITALASGLNQPFLVETVATRESILRTAPLVGRERELETLLAALREAMRGSGRTWLVGGESGVGKSRLLDEIRTRALIDAVLVVRGQAVSQGGGPYHVWRDVLSNLLLRIEVSDDAAKVLKAIVPDIAALLGREVPDAPAADSQAAQAQLLFAVEEVFRAQPSPALVILEDLQWVGSESLTMLAWLTQPVTTLPILVLGSFRDDDAPELPAAVKDAHLLILGRLDAAEIAALGESMIGPTARRADVIELLTRETEGLPFFIVEVVRTLAESSGRLEQITGSALPSRVMSGGMQRVVRRRLSRVPSDALPALKVAATIGREIDVDLMRAAQPKLVVDEWADACARTAVLTLRDQQWCFAHDKLREQLLEDLSPSARRALHRTVAEAIERTYPDRNEYVTALAHHWRQAGEPKCEARYAYHAGVLALQTGACQEAVAHLSRTLELLRVADTTPAQRRDSGAATGSARPRSRASRLDLNARVDPDSPEFHLGRVESALSEATYRLGDLGSCREHSERALVHFGQYVPSGKRGWPAAVARQLVLRCAQALWNRRPSSPTEHRHVASEIGRVQLRLTDTHFYSLRLLPILWSSLRTVNQCEPAGPSPELAQGYVILALLAGAVPLRSLANTWSRRALMIAESAGTERDVAWVLSRTAVFQIAMCLWRDAEAGIGRASDIAERVGDLRLWEECHGQTGVLALYSGQLTRGLALFGDAHRLCRRSGNRQIECWGLLGQGDILVRLGRHDEALALYDAALAKIDENAMKTEAIWGFGMLALARLHSGDAQGAYEMADRALWHVLNSKPVAYWTQQGTAATAEVFTSLLETDWRPSAESRSTMAERARQAVGAMRRYARHIPLGRPHAHLWHGLNEWISGHHARAFRLWQKTLDLGELLQTPYECGRAHLEIGRHLRQEAYGRRHHLDQAAEIFDRLGCAPDREQALAELGRARIPGSGSRT
ncbi:MAG: AAA family ATPase [Deltaproteobacteria bacterium]|nr:AAA family ATPase [Deltaproteobacteria bacterium]